MEKDPKLKTFTEQFRQTGADVPKVTESEEFLGSQAVYCGEELSGKGDKASS